jgi:hypothetical protein
MNTPRLFLTDYASYNEGKQFEFGHWVDLDDFADADEFSDYITEHLAACDKKSPLGFGSIREEPMFTDFENFPRELYSESCNPSDLEALFEYLNLDDDDKTKIQVLMAVHGYGIKEAISDADNCYIREFDPHGDDKYYIFEEYYPDIPKVEEQNDYLQINYDAFIRNEFHQTDIDGTTYLVS